MATLVCFHAHPDDEALTTGGVMAQAAAAGHRVVLVVATGGELGEVPDDLAPGETLVERRRAETLHSAEILGVARVEWLGYEDSGMAKWEPNDNPAAFVRADVDEAAGRLARILRAEDAAVLTVYDRHGNYGHPDHVQVHVVGHRAGELAGTPNVYEATMNTDDFVRVTKAARSAGIDFGPSEDDDPAAWTDDGLPVGTPEAQLTTAVDVMAFVAVKRAALACHRSQVTDIQGLLGMPDEYFARSFGTEWFIHTGTPPGIREHVLAELG
ncbi:MAG TPA: PIG-L family deacetylase [Acidimicrobiales bacterium]|nr:PIG-L family deacetylase [Acidimicrobiales bacterium]